MKIIRYSTAENYEPEENWKRVSLCNEKDISVEHFVKPPHHCSPLHEHQNAQVLIVLEGKLAVITDKEGEQILDKGDTAYIPGDEPHIVKNVLDHPSVGIDIFIPGRSFDFWLKRKKQ
jgi:quercetin dioxygenase-like cupin family protein